MKNLGTTQGRFVDGRRFPFPTVQYENLYDGRNYLCFVWWKWYIGLYWEDGYR